MTSPLPDLSSEADREWRRFKAARDAREQQHHTLDAREDWHVPHPDSARETT